MKKKSVMDPLDPPFNFTRKEINWPPLFPTFPMLRTALFRKDVYLNAYYVSYQPQKIIKLSNLDLNDGDNRFLQKWREENEELVPFTGRSVNGLFKTSNTGIHIDGDTLKSGLTEGLKDLKLVWLLIDRFFSGELYIGMPYINKHTFIKSVKVLIGSRNEMKHFALELENAADLATIGVLLIVMIVSSSSLYNFNKELYSYSDNEEDLQYILDHKVSDDLYRVLISIDKELKMNEPELSTYQFFVMYAYFQVFDPEAIDCVRPLTTDRTLFLFDLGTHFSLNIDPDELDEVPNNERNFLRRLWYGVINIDLYQTLYIGGQRVISPESYNTKLPEVETVDDEEKSLNKFVVNLYETYHYHFSPIFDLIMNVRDVPSLSQVLSELSKFEERSKSFRTLEEIVLISPCGTVDDRYDNLMSLHTLIASHLLMFMIYHHIHIIYSTVYKDLRLSLDYLFKALQIFQKSCNFLLFVDEKHTVYNFQKTFGTGFFAFPSVDVSIRTTYLILFTILGRTKLESLAAENSSIFNQEKLDVINNISHHINYIIEISILERYSKCSSIYYQSWTFTKLEGHMLEIMLNDTTNNNALSNSMLKYFGYLTEHRSKTLSYKNIDIEDLKRLKFELEAITEAFDTVEETVYEPGLTPFLNNFETIEPALESDNCWLERISSDTLYLGERSMENSTKRQKPNSEDDIYSLNTSSMPSTAQKDDTLTEQQRKADNDTALKEVGALLKYSDVTELEMI